MTEHESALEGAARTGENETRGGPDVCVFAPVTLLTVTIERNEEGDEEVHLHAGGQGVWMARMIVTLGGTPALCSPLGGETGAVLRFLLGEEGIEARAVDVPGFSPVWIQDRRNGERQLIFESPPPSLNRHDSDELYSVTLAEALAAKTCVFAGSHGSTTVVPEGMYRRLAADLAASDVKTVADLSAGQLTEALEGGVHLLKVSSEELTRDGHARDASDEELWRAIAELQSAGADNVVVSLGEAGLLAAVGGRRLVVRPPELEVADARGAGDSMSGAFGLALAKGHGWADVLRQGAAAGAMAVTRHGSGSGHAEAISALAERVVLEVDQG